MPVSNQDLASNIIKKSKLLGADQSEVFISTEKSLKIDVLNQKLESSNNISSGGIGLRIIKHKRLGFAYTALFDDYSIEELINAAIANSKNTHQDELLDFPENNQSSNSVKIYDEAYGKILFKDKLNAALTVEKSAYEYSNKIKKTEKVTYSETISTISIANSKGINTSYKKSYFGAAADVIAEEKGHAESGHWFSFNTLFNKINPHNIGRTAAKKATSLLGAKAINSRKMNIILTPFTAAEILEALSPTLSAESVIKSKSLFAGKMGSKVVSQKISIIDNGTLDYGIGSAPFDGEGHATSETILITNGDLSNYLFNYYTAKKLNKYSTGNAMRHSFKSTPEISPSNLYIKNGSTANLISKVDSGLLIDNIIGAHTINPISGDFSVGIVGYLIEKGSVSHPVRGITLAGNIIDILNKIEDIGSDLEFTANIGSPSILISDVSIGGINT